MDTRRDGSRLLEAAVESHLERQMKRIGGRAFKFMPAVKGNPDRLVVFPLGRIYFVELKRPGAKPSPAQVLWHHRLFEMGHVVHVIDSRATVDAFVAWGIATGPGVGDAAQQRARDMLARDAGYLVPLEGLRS